MSDTRPGQLYADFPRKPGQALLRHNLLLTRALDLVRQGELEQAAALVEHDPDGVYTLGQVFRLYQNELETRTLQLEETQQRVEQALAWHARLFQLLPMAAVLVDRLGMIVDANARALDELGLDEALKKVQLPLRRLAASTEAEHRLTAALSALRPEAPAPESQTLDDMELRTPDGQLRWADIRLSQLPPHESEPVHRPLVLVVFSDRTARVEAQRAREAAAEADQRRARAESASAAKTRLLSRLSHELRTPLNAVLGFSHLMLTDEQVPTTQARRRLEHIHSAGQHLLDLVEDVLEINRVEAGAQRLAPAMTPLMPLVRDVLAMHEPLAMPTALTLQAEGDETLCGWTDPRRAWEVLTNLVGNAVKYNRRGGLVRVHVGRAEAPGMVAVAVQDTGIGLNPSQLAHLFEPFNRLGAQHTDVPGHGLGLSIVQTLLQAMGGTLAVQSDPGRGSTFTVCLPARAPGTAGTLPSAA